MKSCDRLRPSVSRVAEGEASPEEAMRVAHHLLDCTACRIGLARERRLAEMLERDLTDRLPVGDDFVGQVMATLPTGPPPRPARGRKRLLRLAVYAALLLSLPICLGQVSRSGLALSTPALPSLGLESAPRATDALFGLAGLLLSALGSASDWFPTQVVRLPAAPLLLALVSGALLLVAVSPALALLATRGLAPRVVSGRLRTTCGGDRAER